MLHSMTGYAARTGETEGVKWDWEIRSVNAKGLDIRMRLAEGAEALEPQLRKAIGKALSRGNISVSLKMTQKQDVNQSALNEVVLETALARLATVGQAARDRGFSLRKASAAEVLQLPGVVEVSSATALPDAIAADIRDLVADLVKMRSSEGEALGRILFEQLNRVEELLSDAAAASEARLARQGALLNEKVAALLDANAPETPERLAQELAILAVKADVTEEIDRLAAHLAAARDHLANGGPIGRRLDFLMQEFNREANTLCSKSGSTELTAIGMDLKLVIEQMREQVQNLE